MNRVAWFVFAVFGVAMARPAMAWGDLGHEVTALIAYRHLTLAAKATVDKLLASDTDTLAPADFASRATWADKYRNDHRETAAWHFVDIEIDQPDLKVACFGYPPLLPGQSASEGPARDCIVDKIEEFEEELSNPATHPAERLLALKFLMHFVGDLHQPLHASDHRDRGGNCIGLSSLPDRHSKNLHAYWDTGVVEPLGKSAQDIAAKLDNQISPAEAAAWSQGDARAWAMESFLVAKDDVYKLSPRPTCDEHSLIVLSADYGLRAQQDAMLQLEKAGIRMALLLNQALQ
jgi:hypothetical protein